MTPLPFHPPRTTAVVRVLLAAGALVASGAFASGQTPGAVLSDHEITDGSGGLPAALLDYEDRFGVSIASLGDLDGDGIVDLAVGAHRDDDGGVDRGCVYILFLDATSNVKSWQKISSVSGGFTGPLADNDRFGVSVANLGDLNGDDVQDLAVGAYRDDTGGANTGAVWILFLNTDGTVASHQKISQSDGNFGGAIGSGTSFGWAVESIGDLDADGVQDLAVGHSRDDDGGFEAGAIWILFLESDGTVRDEQKIGPGTGGFTGTILQGDRFGSDVSSLGDIDRDGVTDLAVGAFHDDDGGSNRGAIWILFLNADGTVRSHQKISSLGGGFTGPIADEDGFGISCQALGDLGGDGWTDLAVGAYEDDDGGANRGAVWILQLDATGTVIADSRISTSDGNLTGPLSNGDAFGSSLAAVGDLDGDGVADLVTGARLNDANGLNQGGIWVLLLDGWPTPAPLVSFDATPLAGFAPLEVQFSNRSTGIHDTWTWDFGDGASSTARSPKHVYMTSGTFSVSLAIEGPGGTDALTQTMLVAVDDPPPVATFGASPESGVHPLEVTFTDTSDGPVTSWSWDFGDGASSTAQHPVHTYTSAGLYTVALTAAGPGGVDTRTDIGRISVTDQPPVADFSTLSNYGFAPLSVAFTDLSSGPATTWAWDFGDGGTSTFQNPTHDYWTSGSFAVSLTVTNGSGTDMVSRPDEVVVVDPTPLAAFTGTPRAGQDPLVVTFSDASGGDVTSWSWDFGDGMTSTVSSPVHTYLASGVYTVSLTIQGPTGSDTATVVDYVIVGNDPPLADFGATPETGVHPLEVAFQDTSAGVVTARSWDFGDGGTSSEEAPTHTYGAAGSYTVALTASGPGGVDTLTRTDFIVVDEQPPAVAFSATPESGLLPLAVTFADSSVNPVTSWAWDFGDGATSTVQHPVHVFGVAGTYSVTLTATGPGGSGALTRTDLITVAEPPPVAGFGVSATNGVRPFAVTFTDTSTNAITAWAWEFGDGGTSSEQNPVHVYTDAGTFSVRLTVTGPGGVDSSTELDLIEVDAEPIVGFFGRPRLGTKPLAVVFRDTSLNPVTSWAWDLGDGTTSTLQNPSHVYTDAGAYVVSLTVTGPGGSDSIVRTDYIGVLEEVPTADFSAAPTSGPLPLTVTFMDTTSNPTSSWAWDFGDGTTSSEQHPQHTYTTAGLFTVALTSAGPGGSATLTRPDLIAAGPPVAGLTAAPVSGLRPLDVVFSDASTGVVTAWSWSFGDGATSTEQNPAHTYVATGTFDVSLTASGPGGVDATTLVGYVTVSEPAPVVDFGALPTSGTAPLTVGFSDASTNLVTAWSWDFGDGTTSTLQDPGHTYALPGTYTVALTASGPGGTGLLTRTDYIVVSEPPPSADFSGSPVSGPFPLSVSFSDASTGARSAWNWTFGDGATSTAANPVHTYGAPGTYTVGLTVSGPGGADVRTRSDYVTVSEQPPVADFGGTPTSGLPPLAVAFSDASANPVTSWSWTFGDGATSTQQHPAHTYANPGSYTVSLTTTGPGGVDTRTKSDFVVVDEPAPVAGFSAWPTTGLAPLDVAFTDASQNVVTAWAWDFGDGSSSTQSSPLHTYQAAGTYSVTLTVSGPGGSDVLTRADYVVADEPPPVSNFIATPRSGLEPLDVLFSDRSTGNVTAWSWTFGDGESSTLAEPLHTYLAPGTYSVQLIVTGPGGSASRTRTNYITVDPAAPIAGFTATPTSGPADLTVAFTDTSTFSVTSRAWTFGDGDTSTEANPVHAYTTPGTYSVGLTVTGPGGTDTLTRADLVTVTEPAPIAAFTATPTNGAAPLNVAFTDTSQNVVTSWMWDFGDGGLSPLENPMHTYQAAGTYTVSLTVAGPGGSDSVTRVGYVTVTEPSPVADFTGAPTSGDWPLNVAFADQSQSPVTSWAWDFGDGASSTERDPQHTYASAGSFTVSLTATGPGGADTRTRAGYVVVDDPPPVASFGGAPRNGTVPLAVTFLDMSSAPVTSRSWDFGDGGSSTLSSPMHTYTEAGAYTVSLTVTGPGGTDVRTRVGFVVALDPPPSADFTATPSAGGAPLTVSFADASSGGVSSWLWDFGDGSSSTLADPVHTYLEAGTYTVALTVAGTGGVDTRTVVDLIVVTPTGFIDGGFESQIVGSPPNGAWTTVGGSGHVVLSGSPDGVFPSNGTRWCAVNAAGSVAASSPNVPFGLGTPSMGAVGIQQTFRFASSAPLLSFEAAFLPSGPVRSGARNDFMCVEVTDGVNAAIVWYADTFTPFPNVSTRFGGATTNMPTIEANLAELFPTADASTDLVLRVLVGNGGDGDDSSRGYVDAFRLGPVVVPGFVKRGCGINPEATLVRVSGDASIANVLVLGIDDPTGTITPGAIPILAVSSYPPPGAPCGPRFPNWGMHGPGAVGEILVSLAFPDPFITRYPKELWTTPGVPVEIALFIPNVPSIVGENFFLQGVLVDTSDTSGIARGVTLGYELVLQP